jgi:hypothetical protein
MSNYFSFDRFITKPFVKALYFTGFIILTAGGLALATWAGMRLHDASISRLLGWRYVALGIGTVVVGNLLWRICCEFWIVLFNMHARLVAIDRSLDGAQPYALRDSVEIPRDITDTQLETQRVAQEHQVSRGVLGLT